MASSLDLRNLLPNRYRDKTIDSLLLNLFNRHLSKTDTVPLFGYIGDQINLQPGEVQIVEETLERQINQITPFVYAQHASENLKYSWYDIVQKLVALGVDYSALQDWFKSVSYNLAPPIDFDKFCNFQDYFWIGKWILDHPGVDYTALSIPNPATYIIPAFTAWGNPNLNQECYVVARGTVAGGLPVSPQPTFPTNAWSDWSYTNLWVHRDDALTFIQNNGIIFNSADMVQATRPIIEYSIYVGLNVAQDVNGKPIYSPTGTLPSKTFKNQLPLFDFYHYDGSHAGVTSATFYYLEDQESAVDPIIGRRVVVDSNGDYVFAHAFVKADSSLYFYRLYDAPPSSSSTFQTIWRKGPVTTLQYSKLDTSGTIINQDMFNNYANYYWIGTDAAFNPSYNPTGIPEYYVIEKTSAGTSDWSIYNYWTHVSNIKRSEIALYAQATKPIIEFNSSLEGELIGAKTQFEQLPRFKQYIYDQDDAVYQLIPYVDNPTINDAYLIGHLFARLADIDPQVAVAVTSNPNILNNTFQHAGVTYIQGLYNGAYYSADEAGNVYGFKARNVTYTGTGDGTLTISAVGSSTAPELITFTFNGVDFDVNGSVTGWYPPVTLNTEVVVSDCTLHINDSGIPFIPGDKFLIEISSYVFYQRNIYINVAGTYRTLTSPSEMITEVQNKTIIPSNPANNDGAWSPAPQLEWNVINETRTQVGEGDLYYHFTTIIGAQPNLIGSSTGDNNWRNLAVQDYGLGGTIKQFDGDTALLISTLLQQGLSTSALIDFAEASYQALSTSINEFVVDQIPDMLVNGEFDPPESGDAIDPAVVSAFKTFFSAQNAVVIASPSVVDDTVSAPFYDTTSSLFNLVVTLPYVGLGPLVQPQKILDPDLNLNMLVHHDGHETQLLPDLSSIAKKIVQKLYVRSSGQETPGIISGFDFPGFQPGTITPYAGQFWFKTTTSQLFLYNAVVDNAIATLGPLIIFGTLFTAGSFIIGKKYKIETVGTTDFTLIGAPSNTVGITFVTVGVGTGTGLISGWGTASFAGTYTIDSLTGQKYGSYAYNRATNDTFQNNGAFVGDDTWAYLGNDEASASLPWMEIKLDLIAQNLELEIETELYNKCPTLAPRLTGYGVPLQADTHYDQSMMIEFQSFGVLYGVADVGTYGDLTNPIYVFWKKTLDYLYAQQKTYFKIDPLTYVRETWGVKHYTVGDYTFATQIGKKEGPTDFVLHQSLLSKLAQPGWVTASSNLNLEQTFTFVYTFTCVSRQDGIFSLIISNDVAAQIVAINDPLPHAPTAEHPLFVTTSNIKAGSFIVGETYKIQFHGTTDFTLIGAANNNVGTTFIATGVGIGTGIALANYQDVNTLNFSDSFINVEIDASLRGFFWGDSFSVSMDTDGNCTTTIVPQEYFKAEGFNQLFVQYGRIYGEDVTISVNSTLLNDWGVKLGYRFGALVNTDTMVIDVQDTAIASSAYNVYVKENDFYNSSWINALRVQLVQRGSTEYVGGINVPVIGPGGTPGEDWIFRVDNYNKNRANLSWYTYDTVAGDYSTFIALDGSATDFPWKRYKAPQALRNWGTPFTVTGIQNFVNFMEGYSDKMAADGWTFSDPNNPISDDTGNSGKIGFQLLIEQFIAQQFSGVIAGSAFLFNPFYRKVWYSAPHGVVSNVKNVLGFETETTCAILDQVGKQVDNGTIRIFRQDALTELVFDVPVYTLHLLTSEYEHVVLFENYSTNTLLIYDPFLGQRSSRIFLEGQKQANFTGKIDFGGHFLLGDEMKKNIENSVDGILGLYDTAAIDVDATSLSMARSLLGYQKKPYFTARGSTDDTQFRFWQGMIANKGTNFSVEAYVNSASFQDAQLQEYWAYKISEYGDSRAISKTEMIVQPDDCTGEYANYIFLEPDDIVNSTTDISNFYDYVPYDYSGYSSSTIVDTTGLSAILPGDETRWYSYSDINQLSYFEAAKIGPLMNDGYLPSSISVGDAFIIRDINGKPVRADCFEILNANSTSASAQVFRESGDYIVGSNPPQFTYPRFSRLNESTILILDLGGTSTDAVALVAGVQYVITFVGTTDFTLIGAASNTVGLVFIATDVGTGNGTADTVPVTGTLQVVAYGPAAHEYSPHLLYDYVNNVLVNNSIIWWDPARGIHHPQAAASITFDSPIDPALYTDSKCQFMNANTQKLKPWGDYQVGKIWWNTKNLYWQPYSDDKEFQIIFDRLARWGSLSDESTINVYEWVKSSTPPSSAPTGQSMTGEPAIANYVQHNRTWWQRPTAWRYSSNPDIVSRAFLVNSPDQLQITSTIGSAGLAVLKTKSFDDLNIAIGTKISAGNYSAGTKPDADLVSIFGVASITSSAYVVVGSATGYADGAFMTPNAFITILNVTTDVNVLRFRTSYLGKYELSNPTSNYLLLTHVASGVNQQIAIADTTQAVVSYNFDTMGVTLTCTMTTLSTLATDIIASLIPTQIYARSAVDLDVPIVFSSDGIAPPTTIFWSTADTSQTVGWIAWNDPTTNPNQGVKPPLNQYEPISGSWTQVGNYLHDVAEDITTKTSNPWTWFDGNDYTPYKSSWTQWAIMKDTVIEQCYELSPGDAYYAANVDYISFTALLTFINTSEQIVKNQCSVYLNGKKLKSLQWSVTMSGPDATINILETLLKKGDIVRAALSAYAPTPTDLAFDPAVSDTDPFQLIQYALDIPYVTEILRDSNDKLTTYNYYYWVKNKMTVGAPNQLSTTSVTQLLIAHNGIYAIPQKLKFYNQLDNRPNRYSQLSVKGLGSQVRAVDRYKLRLNKDPTLRDRDDNIKLKPTFTEWKLLRQGQLDLIPMALWDTLTDTMCGSTKLNIPLPYSALSLYDQKNGTTVSYGVDDGQIMDKPNFAIATVEYTIRNTQVDKYVNGALVPDYISYAPSPASPMYGPSGQFDINQLSVYMSTPANIRQFMSDLWRYAKPTQVNEIFFQALLDMAANDLEIDKFFKTSFISLSDVKTIVN